MGGGLMQLVAYGAQDVYLTGNPQITFFKVVYRRHTNFSMESIAQTLSGSNTYGGNVTSTISRNGDLVGKMHLEVSGIQNAAPTNICSNYGSALLRNVDVEIGGQLIDRHSGLWLETWEELTNKNLNENFSPQIGAAGNNHNHDLTTLTTGTGGVLGNNIVPVNTFYIPLKFWFNRHAGLALPLIALQYHEVKIKITYDTRANMMAADNGADTFTATLYADYIYLDTDERRRFAQVSHEYLIEQIQTTNLSGLNAAGSFNLNLNHPVKELIIVGGVAGTATAGTSSGPSTPVQLCAPQNISGCLVNLKLNGHERMAPRPLNYYTRCQVYDYHSGPGGKTPEIPVSQILLLYIHLHLSLKNINHPEHAISQELIMHS